jgi:hypothetical protein
MDLHILAGNSMKKLFFISILSAFLFSSVGYSLLAELKKAMLKMEMRDKIRATIPLEECTKLALSDSESDKLEWEEEDEFSFKGELYDVIYREKTMDGSVFYCIKDTKENDLVRDLIRLNEKENDPLSQKNKTLKKIIWFFQNIALTYKVFPQERDRVFQFKVLSVPVQQANEHFQPPRLV